MAGNIGQVDSVQAAISPVAIREYLANAIPSSEGEVAVEALDHREHQSYLIHSADKQYVLRLGSLEQVNREWTMLSALTESRVPVPEPVSLCTDFAVIGEPFYLRRHVAGHIVKQRLPKEWPRNASTRQEMSAALVDLLLQVHAVDTEHIKGVSGDGYLLREMDYWRSVWNTSPFADMALMGELSARLLRSLPQETRVAVVHGDFRLQHVVFAPDNPGKISAMVGWEDCGIGDPLCDMGMLLTTWVEDPEDPLLSLYPEIQLVLDDGFYSRRTVLHEYAASARIDLQNIDWYMAFGTFKLVAKAARIIAAGKIPEIAHDPYTNKAIFDAIDGALQMASASNIAGLNGRN